MRLSVISTTASFTTISEQIWNHDLEKYQLPIFWIIACLYCNNGNYLDLFTDLLFSAEYNWSLTSKFQKPEVLIFSITKKPVESKSSFNILEVNSNYINHILLGKLNVTGYLSKFSFPKLRCHPSHRHFILLRRWIMHTEFPLLISKMRFIFILYFRDIKIIMCKRPFLLIFAYAAYHQKVLNTVP